MKSKRILELSGIHNPQKVWVLVGPPSVGKSTFIQQLPPSYVISRDNLVEQAAHKRNLTYDHLFLKPTPDMKPGDFHPQIPELGPVIQVDGQTQYQSVWEANREVDSKLHQQFDRATQQNMDIVVDMTNMNRKSRSRILKKLEPRHNFQTIAVIFPFEPQFLDTIKQLAHYRALEYQKMGKSKTITPQIIDMMVNNYQPPTPEEGFDQIIYHDNRNQLTQALQNKKNIFDQP